MRIKEFTYYRTADHSRGFLVAGIEGLKHPNDYSSAQVALLEFGIATAKRLPYKEMEQLIAEGKMVLFTPKVV